MTWLAPIVAVVALLLLVYCTRKRRERDIDLGFVARTPERLAMFNDAENRRGWDNEEV